MRELWKELACVLAGLLAVAAGLCEMAGDYSRVLMLLGTLVAVLYAPFVIRAWMAMRSTRRELAKLGTPACVAQLIPYHELAARFEVLCRVDKGAAMGAGYLDWHSSRHGRILIEKVESADWKALYWVHDAETMCDIHGLALYRRGELAIDPESAKNQFAEAFMGNILLSEREEFKAWLADEQRAG